MHATSPLNRRAGLQSKLPAARLPLPPHTRAPSTEPRSWYTGQLGLQPGRMAVWPGRADVRHKSDVSGCGGTFSDPRCSTEVNLHALCERRFEDKPLATGLRTSGRRLTRTLESPTLGSPVWLRVWTVQQMVVPLAAVPTVLPKTRGESDRGQLKGRCPKIPSLRGVMQPPITCMCVATACAAGVALPKERMLAVWHNRTPRALRAGGVLLLLLAASCPF